MASLEEDIELLALQNRDISPERWKFYPDLGPYSHWASQSGYSWYAKVDNLIRQAPTAICLISPYPYVRDCKIWMEKGNSK